MNYFDVRAVAILCVDKWNNIIGFSIVVSNGFFTILFYKYCGGIGLWQNKMLF